MFFSRIGKIEDKKGKKEIYTNFHMRPGVAPEAQKQDRYHPYFPREPLKKWLDDCVAQDIIEKVPDGEAITWCSPLVVHPKPRYKNTPKEDLEPHMIQASIDLRVPNKLMERTRISQATIVEDFTYKFHDCTVFSKMDMRSG